MRPVSINPVMWDAPRIRLHLSIVEALNVYVPYTVTWLASANHRLCAWATSLLPLRHTCPAAALMLGKC
ncbi:hypothetical protein Y032_0057g2792 [Ancylostoma ceylanicum]|uniref:Uncharacterized protein n=1 Tax=Ancylostoma ceylanicum TaxID=53326 RepID=A0A016U6E6_9BILA|nr:hypothetical protein Y032_0057g2792 [Ancylostoma ceylanicum]